MVTTPDRRAAPEPSISMIAITEAQKQALVDNLQLEITERARKLRAQSALQAQGLRVRLEMRVNRIPQALRKTNMQDLLDKYSAKAEVLPRQNAPTAPVQKQATVSPVMNRGVKRASDALHVSDKENEAPEVVTLENPKKRAKTAVSTVAANTAAKAAKAVTRKPVPGQVLSPKSHNSRTLPTSPIKIASPIKTFVPRPASPAKPLLTGPAPITKPTRAPSRQVKRPAPVTAVSSQSVQHEAQRKPSARNSSDSDSTATTTIMKKSAATAKSTKAAPSTTTKKVGGFKGAIASLTGSKRGKKAAEAAPAPVPEPAKTTTIGGRTLRKRGSTPKTTNISTTTTKATTTRPLPSRANTTASQVSSESTAAASAKSSATTSTTRAKVKGIVQSFHVIPRNEIRKSISKLSGERKRSSSSGGTKKFGLRRLAKAVEKGRALFNSPGKKT